MVTLRLFYLLQKKGHMVTVSQFEKIECVGHIQKRMGNRLRKLKASFGKNKLSDKKTIGGKGRLTDVAIKKLTTYYGNAIRANAYVNEMRQAVWAHTASTDYEPKHWFCPKGSNSWCKYNVSVHNNKVKEFKHKNTFPEAVSQAIKPVFKELSNLKLLRKCLGDCKMRFSEPQTCQFVELLREHECLWNNSLDLYKNKKMRDRAIAAISTDMAIPGFGDREVRRKLKSLKSTYHLEVGKIQKSIKSGMSTENLYVPNMKWFSVMDEYLKNVSEKRHNR
ncbi:unnamed protein product [Larinioides sclopetarius]|uniref:MADF domain-containing protein n=1 Tax=Larinioides sclopetarius TaxID=280406 RepID=A0AAV2BE45_9ARAC